MKKARYDALSERWQRVTEAEHRASTRGLAPGRLGAKDAARSEAIRRWPALAGLFARVKDDGRAEACLIGWAGLQRA
jgi:hypothetical protein